MTSWAGRECRPTKRATRWSPVGQGRERVPRALRPLRPSSATSRPTHSGRRLFYSEVHPSQPRCFRCHRRRRHRCRHHRRRDHRPRRPNHCSQRLSCGDGRSCSHSRHLDHRRCQSNPDFPRSALKTQLSPGRRSARSGWRRTPSCSMRPGCGSAPCAHAVVHILCACATYTQGTYSEHAHAHARQVCHPAAQGARRTDAHTAGRGGGSAKRPRAATRNAARPPRPARVPRSEPDRPPGTMEARWRRGRRREAEGRVDTFLPARK